MADKNTGAETRRVVNEIHKITGFSRLAINQTASQLVGMGLSETKNQALAYMLEEVRK